MIVFHRLLIATAIVFCLGLAVWMVVSFRTDGAPLMLVLGISFGVAALGLSYYLKHLDRFLHR
ncbi:MAG TPA: hypothetical protein VGA37_15575 [Gemmatimonadales bacterium]